VKKNQNAERYSQDSCQDVQKELQRFIDPWPVRDLVYPKRPEVAKPIHRRIASSTGAPSNQPPEVTFICRA
jgi:hypothetical protein